MTPRSIPAVRDALAEHTRAACEELAATVLDAAAPATARAIARAARGPRDVDG